MNNGQLFHLQALANKDGIKPTMIPLGYCEDSYNTVFHADLDKLISYWEFSQGCIPSFIENKKNKPIASLNPVKPVLHNRSFIEKLLGLNKYSPLSSPQNQAFKYLKQKPYINHWHYNESLDLLYPNEPSAKGKKMPKVDVCYGKTTIKSLDKHGNIQTIASSDVHVEVADGRHTLRFIEFVSADLDIPRDIYILINRKNLKWFEEHCKFD